MMGCVLSYKIFFFFFQAEDGIRDGTVTGVQTCALPILVAPIAASRGPRPRRKGHKFRHSGVFTLHACAARSLRLDSPDDEFFREGRLDLRSEERRVGKECRSRWSWYQYKKRCCVMFEG